MNSVRTVSIPRGSLWQEARQYVGNIRKFDLEDWVRYSTWMMTIFGLFFGVMFFLLTGHFNGVSYPPYVWFIPAGTGLFATALCFDDIGHRTLYKEALKSGEGHVHQMIIITAVGSVVALCFCFQHPDVFAYPALALIGLSLFYSAVDEALHWHRYLTRGLDRVEMWSHFFAILGHVVMIVCWWQWMREGYLGVKETMVFMPF